ncbi:probable fucosyltransferase 8 [Triticum dicoccoides]|uniref:probable fucosyltransferase 8 n=1 Tax=Triticum dicoccoides TaxID=85692 RepID=UPI00188E0CE9|nr:probable fucosyltransferase 8 [Triticum dicoccoides]
MEGDLRGRPADAREKRRDAASSAAIVVIFLLVALTHLLVLASHFGAADPLIWWQQRAYAADDGPGGNAVAPDRLLSPYLEDNNPAACLSRHEASRRWKPAAFPVPPYLVERLRRYEANHRRCGPRTALYREAVSRLRSASRNADHAAAGDRHHTCKYVVWIPTEGLGNRMLSLVSTFLYALLTDRVLLVHEPPEMEGLFCEPFPGTTWLLPPADFPHKLDAAAFSSRSKESYVNMLHNNIIRYGYDAQVLPAYVYLHLETVFLLTESIKLRLQNHTFCEEDHRLLNKFDWMVVKSDNYFAVALFMMPMYRRELERMFPAKGAVFHHLGRYLLRPGNRVWGMVDRFFEGYLAGADERLGMHVRNKQIFPVPPEIMFKQILRCAREHHLLPQVLATSEPPTAEVKKKKAVAVLMLSLKPEYHDKLHAMYYTNATVAGDMVVSVHQPSHDGEQQSDARAHNERALAEIYLLSFCDRMVTTGWSTFGYVAQALAGIRPWMLLPVNRSKMRADVACVRPPSVEPCMHPQPSLLTCQQGPRHLDDPVKRVPFLRHCEDVPLGLKLLD